MTGTTRGPRIVRQRIRDYVRVSLPDVIATLREQWGDSAAFPPAGPEPDAAGFPSGDQVRTSMGRPIDNYPIVNVEIQQAKVARAETATLTGEDAIGYFVTYSVQAYVWVDVDLPDSLPVEQEREYVTDVRDDLQVAMRYLFLDRPVSDDPPLLVLPNSYAEDFGEPQAAGGQRFTVGGRARFDVRAQERLSRRSLATVSPETQVTPDTPPGQVAVEMTVGPMHPALQ